MKLWSLALIHRFVYYEKIHWFWYMRNMQTTKSHINLLLLKRYRLYFVCGQNLLWQQITVYKPKGLQSFQKNRKYWPLNKKKIKLGGGWGMSRRHTKCLFAEIWTNTMQPITMRANVGERERVGNEKRGWSYCNPNNKFQVNCPIGQYGEPKINVKNGPILDASRCVSFVNRLGGL